MSIDVIKETLTLLARVYNELPNTKIASLALTTYQLGDKSDDILNNIDSISKEDLYQHFDNCKTTLNQIPNTRLNCVSLKDTYSVLNHLDHYINQGQ